MKHGRSHFIIVLLDPNGRSQSIHEEALCRELMDHEVESLDMGPEVPVFEVG